MDCHTQKKGSILGGTLLIAGCCIGAGMLGLPVLSAASGFIPSLVIFLACWIFMMATGFLVLEVNLWFGKEVSLITMTKKTLGIPGAIISWTIFSFLFYSLIVAYTAASESLIHGFFEQFAGFDLPQNFGSGLFILFFGSLLFIGIGAVDWFNRCLMLGLISTYILLVFTGIPHIESKNLIQKNWSMATTVIPVAIISFGFHNMIPSLTSYFKSDARSLKFTLFLGSGLTLIIYLLWEFLILGIVPTEHFKDALDKGEIATQALKNVVGAAWILDIAELFAFFAIVTSFLSVALSFVDFLADGLKIPKDTRGKLILISMVLIPPFFCAILYPTIFLSALNFAGGFCTVILFGILPSLMVWKGRYAQNIQSIRLVPGGKITLVTIIIFSIWVMLLQLK